MQKLVKPLAELLELAGVRVLQGGEALRRKARDLVVADGAILGERVADAELRVPHQANNVARVRLVNRLALLPEELVRTRKAHLPAGARVRDNHVALKAPRADAHERDAVAVLRVHVRLDLEDKAGERPVVRGHQAVAGAVRTGRRGTLQERVEQQLDAEVVHRAAEENRGQLAPEHRFGRILAARELEHLQLLHGARVVGGVELFAHQRILQAGDRHRGAVRPRLGPLEKVQRFGPPVVDALEAEPGAERPVDRVRADAEHAFEFIDQRERVARRAVHLIHECKDRHAPAAADFEELARLALDPLPRVDHHHHGVHGGEHAVSVLGEIFVTGGVEQIDAVAVVVELQHRGADRDAALALQLHPVRSGRPLAFAGRDRPGKLHRAAVEQQLFGQRRLARVGVGNDGERPSPGNLFAHDGCACVGEMLRNVCEINGTGGRGRTDTWGEPKRILSPSRLPIPPRRLLDTGRRNLVAASGDCKAFRALSPRPGLLRRKCLGRTEDLLQDKRFAQRRTAPQPRAHIGNLHAVLRASG